MLQYREDNDDFGFQIYYVDITYNENYYKYINIAQIQFWAGCVGTTDHMIVNTNFENLRWRSHSMCICCKSLFEKKS